MKKTAILTILFMFLISVSMWAQKEEYGLASYYSDDFQGRSTAYGQTYNKDELTCAHKDHPYGTMLRITRLDTKKTVKVKVIDKGPFIKGRVVDLSRRAAEILGIIDMGAVEVKVEILAKGNNTPTSNATTIPESYTKEVEPPVTPKEKSVATTAVTTAAPPPSVETKSPELEERQNQKVIQETTPSEAEPLTTRTTIAKADDRFSKVGDDYNIYGLYRIVLEKPNERTGYGVQVASLSNYENVLQKVADLQAKWFDNVLVSIEPSTGRENSYKVILGPFETQKAAQRYQQSLIKRYKIKGFVINLGNLKY